MKIAIWGCRDGEYLCEQISAKKAEDYQVEYFVDNACQYKNIQIRGKKVLDVEQLAEKYAKHEIDVVIVAVRKGYSRYCIIKQLREKKIDRVLLLKPSPLTYRLPIVFRKEDPLYDKQWMELGDEGQVLIQHLETHVADGCNLNCKGCLHFANLYKKTEKPDLDRLLCDIEVLSTKCEIFQFRVLGGEPLLNRGLPSFLKKLRILLPHTDIAVISNGILIPKADPELFAVMRDNYIGFNLTLYPPTLKMKEHIYCTLDRYHVAYGSHEVKTNEFERFLTFDKTNVSTTAYRTCVSRGILVIREGKLYKCPLETYIERYLETYQMDEAIPEGINIRDTMLDWKNVIKQLYLDCGGFCSHCVEKPEIFSWGNGKPEREDWLVRGG